MNKIEIYYFSGTGNSLYIAKQLQNRIPRAKLIPIVSLLYNKAIETNAETVGFVFPLHGMTIPIPVKKFLKKVDIKSAQYIFAVATRAGTKCLAFTKIEKLLKDKRKNLDSYFALTMASNDPKFKIYTIPTKEEIIKIEEKIQNQLDLMGKIIVNKEKIHEEDKYLVDSSFLLERIVLFGMKYAEYDGGKNYFYSDAKCTSCGICEKVCLSQKVKINNNKPIWQNDVKCYLCYACINYCPEQAAQIKTKWYMKSYTAMNGRYPHPYAKASDIAEQKEEKAY